MGADFNPEVGFLRRTAFKRSYGQARFSPRPRNLAASGSCSTSPASTTSPTRSNRPESKEVQGNFQLELNNSDTFSVDLSRNYERLPCRFEVGRNLFVPARRVPHDAVARHLHVRTAASDVRAAHGGPQRLLRRHADGTDLERPRRAVESVLRRAAVVVEPRRRATEARRTATCTAPAPPTRCRRACSSRRSCSTSRAPTASPPTPASAGSTCSAANCSSSTATAARRSTPRGIPGPAEPQSFVVKVTRLLRW